MHSLRRILLGFAFLSAAAVGFVRSEEPEPGKVRLIRSLDVDAKNCTANFSADGRRLLTIGDFDVCMWNPDTGAPMARFSHKNQDGHDQHADEAVLSSDGRIVVALFGGRTEMQIIEADSGKVLHRITDHRFNDDFSFGFLALSPDGKTVASTDYFGVVHLWDADTAKESRRLSVKPPKGRRRPDVNCFSPDGKTVVVALDEPSVRLCDPSTGEQTLALPSPTDYCQAPRCAFSPEGNLLAVAAPWSGVIEIWDLAANKVIQRLDLAPLMTYAEFAESLGLDPKTDVRPLSPGLTKLMAGRHKYGVMVNGLSFAPDGKTLAVAAYREEYTKPPTPKVVGFVQLWEVTTGGLRHSFKAQAACVAFRPREANVLFTGSNQETELGGRLWNWRDPCLDQASSLGDKQVDQLWEDLGAEDAATAYRAESALLKAPQKAVDALVQRLRPIVPVPEARVAKLLAELDDEDFPTREKAYRQLANLGEAIKLALHDALSHDPSDEVKQRLERLLAQLEGPLMPEQLRGRRAVEVLECIGSPEAKEVIAKLAEGAAGAAATEDARATLKRLRQNSSQ